MSASADDLIAEAIALREFPASVISATDIGTYAMEYGLHKWEVFPLRGKVPAIAGGRGVLDATNDLAQIAEWWGGRYAGCNIGGRIPEGMFVLDVDPRNGGAESITELKRINGPLPTTLATLSGRGDGGSHRFYRRPPGKISSKRLGPGLDIKTPAGYVVLPPSIHPDTGMPYKRLEHPVAAPPQWLVDLILPEPITEAPRKPRATAKFFTGPSIADEYSANTSWADILIGWTCPGHDYDDDGAVWLHPTATSNCSATIRYGQLFVYSPNTPFEVTEAGAANGYTRFKAYAVLNHDGDMSAAARALSGKAA